MRGQALIEFALVLPLLLAIVVGGMAVGILLIHRSEMLHAAQELATDAAATTCEAAMNKADSLLGYQPESADCDLTGHVVTVSLAHGFPALVPFLPDTVTVTARAIHRD
jgi:hypothetical protein